MLIPRQEPKFESKCEDLEGHIYDCSDARQSDMFMKTKKILEKKLEIKTNMVGIFGLLLRIWS
jgi:hypothetical protein